MLNLLRTNCVLAKPNFPNQTSNLLLINAKTNFRRNDKVPKLSGSYAGVHNRCSQIRSSSTESVVPLNPLNQSLFSLYSKKKNLLSSRNFSASNTVRSWMQSNQEKEKVKNYMFFGAVIISVIFVSYMLQTMQYHQDYVHIEPSDNKK